MNEVDREKFGQEAPREINFWFTEKFDFKEALKEGGTAYYSLRAQVLASILHYKEYSGIVKLGGYFETAENKKEKSKSTINFDVEKYFRK